MDDPGPHDDPGVEMLRVAAVPGHERDHHVGVATLWPDESLGVGLPPVELVEHLIGRVAATRAVALDLPLAAQILRRVEEHPDVVGVAHATV